MSNRTLLPTLSVAAQWRPLRRFVGWEGRLGSRASRHPLTGFLHELVRFGVKQAWACLFGALMLALLLGTHRWYPAHTALSRYDVLTIAAVLIQAGMLLTGLETRDEAKVILLFHIAGTVMEVFKTAAGSWVYPEPSLLRLGGVPLFTGFMYAAVGSYLARAWRLFDLRFLGHPPLPAVLVLAAATYINFFSHHVLPDVRPILYVAAALLFGRSWVHYRIWRTHRRMPLLLGLVLIAVFIWFAENIGTLAHAWVYPHQARQWSPVRPAKIGAWFLLVLISYAMVAANEWHTGDPAACADRTGEAPRVRPPRSWTAVLRCPTLRWRRHGVLALMARRMLRAAILGSPPCAVIKSGQGDNAAGRHASEVNHHPAALVD